MGNRVINPDNIKAQADSIIRAVHNADQALGDIQSAVGNFYSDSSLDGMGWSAAKNHMHAYSPVTNGIDALIDYVTTDCSTLKGSVGGEVLREAEIEEDIRKQEKVIKRCNKNIRYYYKMMANSPVYSSYYQYGIKTNRQTINFAEKAINKFEKKIEKIDEIEANTDKLFTSYGSLVSAINTGLSALASSTKGGFNMPKNPPWMEALKAQLDSLRAQKLEEAMGNDPILKAYSKDPVCLTTGNFIYERTDFAIGGSSSFDFSRFYNSMGDDTGSLGKGWIHNYEICLKTYEIGGSKRVDITREDGNAERFTKVSSGAFVPISNSRGRLSKENDLYTYTSDDSRSYVFDENGRCKSRTDKHGIEVEFKYEDDRLATVAKTTGEAYNFHYNDNGLLSCVADHTGRKVVFEYNNKSLIKASYDNGGSYSYGYDDNGFLCSITEPSGITTVTNNFDDRGRTIEQAFPDDSRMTYEYRDSEKLIIQNERNGSESKHYSDSRFRTVRNAYRDCDEKYTYNSRGRRLTETDKNGNETVFTYDEKGNVTKVVNAEGAITEIDYNDDDMPLSIKIDGKTKLTNEYSSGHLRSQTDGIGRRTVYFYGSSNEPEKIVKQDMSKVLFEYDKRGNIITVTDELEGVTHYERDDLNRLSSLTTPNGNRRIIYYDSQDGITGVELPDGSMVTYARDKSGRLLREELNGQVINECRYNSIGRPAEISDALGRTTKYTYDEMWNISEEILPNGGIIKYSYNENNQLESIRDPEGGVTSYTYDGEGNVLSQTDPMGNVTEYEYNKVNALTHIIYPDGFDERFEYDGAGNIILFTDKAGNNHTYHYDDVDQLIEEMDPLGNSKKYTYTEIGRLEAVTDEAGQVTRYEYYPGGTLKRISYPDGSTEEFVVDKEGNVTEYVNRDGYRRSYEFDCMNRVVSVEGEDGEKTCFDYDLMGNMIAERDDLGTVIEYQYSMTGQLIKATDGLGNETEYDYDEMDELIEIRRYAENKQEVKITRYVRDLIGRITRSTDPLGNSEIFRYDSNGRLCEKVDRDGYTTQMSYTYGGDLSEIVYDDGRNARYSYDPLGRIKEIEDWLGTTIIRRDKIGRIENVIYPSGDALSYVYGKSGEKRKLTYPDGQSVLYEYDDRMRLSKLSGESASVAFGYDDHGRMESRHFSNGINVNYSYTGSGNLSELTYSDNDGITDRFVYEYDARNNIVSIEKTRRNIPEDTGLFEYEYSRIGQLTRVSRDGSDIRAYEYDAFGNRKKMSAFGSNPFDIQYRYDLADRLIEENRGEEEISYEYDSRGNLTGQRRSGKRTASFSYGAMNMLEREENLLSGESGEYTYNGLGQRVGEKTASDEVSYVLDVTKEHSNILQRRDGSTIQNILWLGSTPSMISGKDTHFYLTDHLGSPIRLMDNDQTISQNHVYDEFGNDLISEGSKHLQPLGFTGHIRDSISNTYSTRERLYMPSTGRFVAEDIIGGIVDDPRTINQYNYCFGSPVRLVDRDGAFPSAGQIAGELGNKSLDELMGEYGYQIGGWVADRLATKPVLDTLGTIRKVTEKTPVSDAIASFSYSKPGKSFMSIALDMDYKDGIYYTRRDCWQRYGGYTDSYDEFFQGFTSAKPKKVARFNYKGEKYTFWAWKGDYYGLGAGAETGIYIGKGRYKRCYTDSKLIMGISVYNKSGGRVLKRDKDTQWWVTGFNPDFQDMTSPEITAYVSVDFSQYTTNGQNEFWDAFISKYGNVGGYGDICIDKDNKTVYFKI